MLKLFRKPKALVPLKKVAFEGDFATFADAVAACHGDPGYNGTAAIDRYVRRYGELNAAIEHSVLTSSAAILGYMATLSLARPIAGVYEVFDFGGGYGAIHDLFSYLYPDLRFRWTVVELPGIVARGQDMGAGESKVFASEIPPRKFSFAIASGALQYVEDPRATFERFCATDVPLLLLNRFPLAPFLNRDRLTINDAGYLFDARIPSLFFSPSWREVFPKFGATVMQWDTPNDVTELDGHRVQFQSILLSR
jgi:putative methyltransferase (TIGR04325 family)